MPEQVAALRVEKLLVRLADPFHPERRMSRRLPAAALTVGLVREWSDSGYDVSIAPEAPDGLVVISRVTKPGLAKLSAAGLEPACVVRGSARYDAFVRLAPKGDPRAVHWQRGGMVVGTKRQLSGGPPVKLYADDGGLAPAGRMLLERAADVVEGVEDSRSMAYEGAVDPIGELDGIAGYNGPLADEQARQVYEQQAAIARYYGLTDPDAVDRVVAVAALKAGADPDRVRAIIRAGSPDLVRRHRAVKPYLASLVADALASPEVRRHIEQQLQRYSKLSSLIDTKLTSVQASLLIQAEQKAP
ncbi:DNA-primase RepB domain-containing protein [Azospirillum brasilense]|uniref:DNA-primase RepB domain-containing protein n=1 Tax=Azospirillum brasilense TaxID=192 RepID=UPI001FFF0776|nr:DNA-primase RepB domain-containing protein [Azospirillum brasilense]